MGVVEERVFSNTHQPKFYCRYIDDTFVSVENEEKLTGLVQAFRENSKLNFTHEVSVDGTLPFPDICVGQVGSSFNTSVFTKATNTGMCLSGTSECPERYLKSVVKAYAVRALSHSSTWKQVHEEMERFSQVLVENGYSNKMVEQQIRNSIHRWYTNPNQEEPQGQGRKLKLYYQAHMTTAHKDEEKRLKRIIKEDVKPTNPDDDIYLTIYDKNRKTSNLVLKNSPPHEGNPLKEHHVVYHFRCQNLGCTQSYIGMTTTRFSKRISCHLQEGAIFQHHTRDHGRHPNREEIIAGMDIIGRQRDPQRLRYLEALCILQHRPSLNTTNEVTLLPSLTQRITIGQREGESTQDNNRQPADIPPPRENNNFQQRQSVYQRSPIMTRSHTTQN